MSILLNTLSDSKLVTLIQDGKVGIMPTDTVYGLVCSASDPLAVQRLYQLKHRHHKPGTIIAADVGQLVKLGLKARYLKPVEQYWPNPLSVVIPNYELQHIHLGKGSIAVRIPDSKELLSLLTQTGPLLTTSANLPDQPVGSSIAVAKEYFGDAVAFYVDGPDFANHKPSTIIRVVDDAVEILREGALKINEAGEIES